MKTLLVFVEIKNKNASLHFPGDIIFHSGFPELPLLINEFKPFSTIFKEKLNYKVISDDKNADIYIDKNILHFPGNIIIINDVEFPLIITDMFAYSNIFGTKVMRKIKLEKIKDYFL